MNNFNLFSIINNYFCNNMTLKVLINVRLHCAGHPTNNIIRDDLISVISGLKELF